MPAATEPQLVAELTALASVYKLKRGLETSYPALQEAALDLLFAERADVVAAGLGADRDELGEWLAATSGGLSNALDGHFARWGRLVGEPDSADVQTQISSTIRYWRTIAAPALTVLSRSLTLGTPALTLGDEVTAAVGDGELLRVTVNDLDEESQLGSAEVKNFFCIEDANTNAIRNQEIFLMLGGPADPSGVERLGSAVQANLTAFGEIDEGGLISNGGFDTPGGDEAAPDSIPGWVIGGAGTISDFTFESGLTDPTAIYLPATRGDEERFSLLYTGAGAVTLTQRIDLNAVGLSKVLAFFSQVAHKPKSAWTGTVEIAIGSVSSTALKAKSGGWSATQWPGLIGAPGTGNDVKEAYYNNFAEEALDVVITITPTVPSDGVYLDDFIWRNLTPVNGHQWGIMPGQTPFRAGTVQNLLGDLFKVTDTDGAIAYVTEMIGDHYGREMPHVPAGNTVPEPA